MTGMGINNGGWKSVPRFPDAVSKKFRLALFNIRCGCNMRLWPQVKNDLENNMEMLVDCNEKGSCIIMYYIGTTVLQCIVYNF